MVYPINRWMNQPTGAGGPQWGVLGGQGPLSDLTCEISSVSSACRRFYSVFEQYGRRMPYRGLRKEKGPRAH